MIIILDFGSQYTQLIARRIREQKVYCEILPFSTPIEEIQKRGIPVTVVDDKTVIVGFNVAELRKELGL